MNRTCQRCSHEWESRKLNPQCCPKCKSYDWKLARKVDFPAPLPDQTHWSVAHPNNPDKTILVPVDEGDTGAA